MPLERFAAKAEKELVVVNPEDGRRADVDSTVRPPFERITTDLAISLWLDPLLRLVRRLG
jgi:hypothetical protein